MSLRYAPRMKIALVHELLTMKGGAERVLKILAAMFPDAPIYTLLYDEKKLGDWFPPNRIRRSPLQSSLTTHYSLLATHSINHHLFLRHFPKAVESWDFSEFDVVLSTSSAFAHGIITNGNPKHVCYVNAPARYLWDRTHDVLDRAGTGPLGWLKRRYLERLFHALRIWDSEAADRPDVLLAASQSVQRRIELYWRRKSDVVYPPIDDVWLQSPPRSTTGGEYLLIVSTLADYKRIDIAIEACNTLKLKLIIAGTGPAEARLRSLAGPTVEFAGRVDHQKLRDLYLGAKATIFPGDEDFGLVPLESLSCGTPVIALQSGGALETIEDGKTGIFFDRCDADSLTAALKKFDPSRFDPAVCAKSAKRFDRATFEKKILRAIDSLQKI